MPPPTPETADAAPRADAPPEAAPPDAVTPDAVTPDAVTPDAVTPDAVAPDGWAGFLAHDATLVAGVAVALTLATYALLGLPPDAPLVAAVACGAFLVYQADRALGRSPEDVLNRPARVAWMRRHRRYVRASLAVAAVGLVATLPLLRPATLAAGAALGLAGAAHVAALPGLAVGGRLKPVLVAAVWAGVTGGLPVVEAGAAWTDAALVLLAYRALALLPNVLLADWADRAGDAAVGRPAGVGRWTPRGLRRRAYAALGAAAVLAALGALATGHPLRWTVDAAGLAVLALAVRATRATPPPLFVLDALVAWPAATALVAWLGG